MVAQILCTPILVFGQSIGWLTGTDWGPERLRSLFGGYVRFKTGGTAVFRSIDQGGG